MLGSVTITDKTFGDLSVSLSSLDSIPRSVSAFLREVQWRLLVFTAKGLQLRATGDSLSQLEAAGCLLAKRLGERIEYDVGSPG